MDAVYNMLRFIMIKETKELLDQIKKELEKEDGDIESQVSERLYIRRSDEDLGRSSQEDGGKI